MKVPLRAKQDIWLHINEVFYSQMEQEPVN